ncbi:hypothetical protein [Bacillus thuringiensis]|uniref:hypothetical protein n=1 Tax=Bacillus thuringiensis TaxID=1428 RepID=UPI001F5B176A|nr:hypothetical protein [Bacillus thuringiensis]
MLKYHFPNVCEDELINIYSYGDFKGQGKYICLFKIENQSFLFWRNDKGNKIYTNLESISVCPQDLVDTYNQSQNVCPQDLNVYTQDLIDTYNQSQNCDCGCK